MRSIGSYKFVVPPTTEYSKVRTHLRPVGTQYRAARGARGVATPLFEEESRGTPSQGVPLGNFFLTADAVLLCAAKKNGVGTTRLAGFCQLNFGACATAESKKAPLAGTAKKKAPAAGLGGK